MSHFHQHAKVSEQTPETEGTIIHWAPLYDALFNAILQPSQGSILALAQLKPGDNVLDTGCGTGRLALAAQKCVGPTGQVHGIDPAPEMIALARRNALKAGQDAQFQVGLAEAMPFPDASFEVVLSRLVFHHLPGDLKQRGLAEMRRVLKPGGMCLVVDFEPPKGALGRHLVENLLNPVMVQVDVRSYLPLLEQAGFSGVESGTTSSKLLSYVRGKAPGN
jgi:ubiquinone/menaquinone biosynthesis C-methylase UbiE